MKSRKPASLVNTWSVAAMVMIGMLVFASIAAGSPQKSLDIVVASHEGLHVWFGQGKARFQASEQGFIALTNTTGIALGDLDSDGDVDLFVTRYQQQPNQVWFNDGKGRFQNGGQFVHHPESWRVALGDLDGDGDLDAFMADAEKPDCQPDEVWLNDGKGFFTDSGQRLGRGCSYDVVLADLDGDRDLDAVVAEEEGTKIWINNGKGVFRDSGQRLGRGAKDGRGIALGDLDGDGDLDAFIAHLGPNEIWLNQGKGQFVLGRILDERFETFAVALGDLDGDGDLDAYLANTMKRPNRVLLNNGKAEFTDSGQRLGADNTLDVALADFDGDGDLDVFEANRASPNRLLLNDGKGHFRDSEQPLGNWMSRKIAVGSVR